VRIAFKLIYIITALLGVSIIAITVMVSWLVSADVGVTAESNNYILNGQFAGEAELIINRMKSAAKLYHNTVSLAKKSGLSPVEISARADTFFAQNPAMLAVCFAETDMTISRFMRGASSISDAQLDTLLRAGAAERERVSKGEVLMQNLSPLAGIPVLGLHFPDADIENGEETVASVASVFFYAQELGGVLKGGGDSVSFILNDAAVTLAHPDAGELQGARSWKGYAFVDMALANPSKSLQTLYKDKTGTEYLGAWAPLQLDSGASAGNVTAITIIPKSAIYSGVKATITRNVILGLVVLAVSIFLVIIFSRTISKPLAALTHAAANIEKGDYTFELSYKGHDEIGILTDTFISMKNGLSNFERFTNRTVARLAREGRISRSGVSRKACVCFAMLRNFDELSEEMDAMELVGFLNNYLAKIVPCITLTGGAVDKFLTQDGAVIMALWGAVETTGSSESDTLGCLKAVLAMRAAIRDMNTERAAEQHAKTGCGLLSRALRITGEKIGLLKKASLLPAGKTADKKNLRIKMGCGINFGELISGQMGSEDRMEYTVIGDSVNLAARFEGPNDLFDTDILVTENVVSLLDKQIRVEELPALEVKGKSKPLRVFALLGLANDGGPRTVSEVRSGWL
jgi:adenylate cyclase